MYLGADPAKPKGLWGLGIGRQPREAMFSAWCFHAGEFSPSGRTGARVRRNPRAGAGASDPCVCHLGAPVLDAKALGMSGKLDRLVVYALAVNTGCEHEDLRLLLLGLELRVSQAEGKTPIG